MVHEGAVRTVNGASTSEYQVQPALSTCLQELNPDSTNRMNLMTNPDSRELASRAKHRFALLALASLAIADVAVAQAASPHPSPVLC